MGLRRPGLALGALAAFWGLAEAMIFFVVPDVVPSLVAAKTGWAGRRLWLALALVAAAAGLSGGFVMYAWGAADPGGADALLDALPAISPAMIDGVRSDLADQGAWAIAVGGFEGTPYKIYAVAAGETGISPLPFAAASAVGRIVRFVLVAAGSALTGNLLPARTRLPIALAAWSAFYAFYWSQTPG